MTEINAYFYKNKIYIGGDKKYQTGAILLEYLDEENEDNVDEEELLDWYEECKSYQRRLHYPEKESEFLIVGHVFRDAVMFYRMLDDVICSLPPYCNMHLKRDVLYDLLNSHRSMFEVERDENGELLDYYEQFEVASFIEEFEDPELMDLALKFNDQLQALTDEYLTFIEDMLRVKKVYIPFLEHIHQQSKFLSNEETAEIVADFNRSIKNATHSYESLQPSGMMTLAYKPLKTEEGTILCESYHFTTIGALLYIELFKGLQNHYLPKKCYYCNRYFLLESAFYSNCCTRPVEGMNGKVCRDVGFRKKYADKLKSDPIWLVYIRAYKRNYARYLKKRMTKEEFQKWAEYALEVRQKVKDGELSFEEYEEKMSK